MHQLLQTTTTLKSEKLNLNLRLPIQEFKNSNLNSDLLNSNLNSIRAMLHLPILPESMLAKLTSHHHNTLHHLHPMSMVPQAQLEELHMEPPLLLNNQAMDPLLELLEQPLLPALTKLAPTLVFKAQELIMEPLFQDRELALLMEQEIFQVQELEIPLTELGTPPMELEIFQAQELELPQPQQPQEPLEDMAAPAMDKGQQELQELLELLELLESPVPHMVA